jgi:molecular chaperone HscC
VKGDKNMTIIGIDLGTTNSLVAYWDDDEAKLIPNVLKQVMTPSVVGLDDEGQVIVGEIAKQRLQTHPGKTAANFKRFMGTNKLFALGKQKFRPEELSSLLLGSLKADAESLLNCQVTEAVISVPAYFSDAQRKATKVAGRLAGLEVNRLINEPTAAAIAYGLHQKQDDTTFLVFDIGGGTFDVSILELFEGVMQVNASSGDNHLGGQDFVDVMMKVFADEHSLKLNKLKGQEIANLRKSAEACKRMLTSQQQSDMSLQVGKKLLQMSVTREQFNSMCADLLLRLRKPLERTLNDSNLRGADLDAVVLVGGASRMPIIRSLAAKMLGQIPSTHINPDETIALGVAIQVGLMQDNVALKEMVLTDVAPYTLGVDVINDNSHEEGSCLFHPIIERNSPIPISRSDLFYSAYDNQKVIEVGIYQGESRLVRDNIQLGTLKLSIPKGPGGSESIEVRFTYDVNGLLEAEAVVMSTGDKTRAVIEGNPGLMTEKEINKCLASLASLKVHPREQLENATLIARGERLFEESLGEKRTYIATLLSQFENVLNQQNPDEITQAVERMNELLDELEIDSPLY